MQRTKSTVVQRVLGGNEEIICHRGTHQYGDSDQGITGASACGLAALNFARVIFEKERENIRDEDLLQAVVARRTVLVITDICAGWSSNLHLEVEDIYRVPAFAKTLKLVSTKYGYPSVDQFVALLQEMQAINTSAVVVITRPPEIIACLKLSVLNKDIFIIFDSHPRPSHPDGAGFILNLSIHGTAARLSEILPVDSRLLSDGDLQWQAQLLANYSGHIFVSRNLDNDPAHLMQTVIESSLAILALRAEVSDVKSQNSSLISENKRVEAELEELEDKYLEERSKNLQSFGSRNSSSYRAAPTSAMINNQVAGLRGPFGDAHHPPSNSHHKDKGPRSSESTFSFNNHQIHAPEDGGDYMIAEQMQLDWLDSDQRNAAFSAQQQQHFDEEDQRLRMQRDELARNAQHRFECGVCFDEQPEDSVARLDLCGHCFCRSCIRDYIGYKLAENRFPIFCPVCMTDKARTDPGVVTDALVQQIGISEKQYETWVELEMVKFSVLIHCRKCERSAYVDRKDLDDTTILVCPLPGCKACQQSITLGGPRHSCDGSSELNRLMKEKGWKFCPGCQTPFLKEAGCNHMTCMSPGCNTHFCYTCGEEIIRSALRRDVQTAITAHYRRCRLFEDVP